MTKKKARVFSREMKLATIRRMEAGENVSALARELQLRRKLLYAWRDNFRKGGPDALRTKGRPRKSSSSVLPQPVAADDLGKAKQRIAELERKIGQQQVELDFFRQALQHIGMARRPIAGSGAKTSTPSSRR